MNATIGNNIIHSRFELFSKFELANFSDLTLEEAAKKFGTPIYIYSEKVLEENAQKALSFPNPFGLSVRYAMKACPNANVLRLFHNLGLHFDASSGYEVLRAEAAGIPSKDICLTAQELPTDFSTIISRGVGFNACSLFQLQTYAKLFPGSEVGIRFNPGLGSGHANRVNTGGPSSSFGIWKDYVSKVKEIAAQSKLKIARIHSHIGAGTDPQVWVHCAKLTLSIASEFADCHTVSLGGGFKVARIAEETPANLSAIGIPICEELNAFEKANKRKLHLEIEPGTFLTANAGVILCKIIDISDTGPKGYNFIKIDSGMSEIIRPGMYGAQHPIWIVNSEQVNPEERNKKEYLVAGHCCESGDILTPSPGNPESLSTRVLGEAQIGDLLAIGGAGAYCAGMSAKNYNSFPEAAEVMLKKDGKLMLIRSRQPIEQITQNEIII